MTSPFHVQRDVVADHVVATRGFHSVPLFAATIANSLTADNTVNVATATNARSGRLTMNFATNLATNATLTIGITAHSDIDPRDHIILTNNRIVGVTNGSPASVDVGNVIAGSGGNPGSFQILVTNMDAGSITPVSAPNSSVDYLIIRRV